jgi:transposase
MTRPHAAGIDIGSASHFVAVPADRDDEPVREFRSFTADLMALADCLTACGIDAVAMEPTGVYWIPLFERLDARGLTVLRSKARNAPKFDVRTRLFKMCGVDLTRIDGIDVTTALAVISETGADMSRFPSDKHFASWMGLCPGTKITGGKVMSGKSKRCANRAAQALRLAAAALRTSQSALGAYFRRMCARMDKPKAITAAAHKLARLIYTMLTKGEEYTDQGQAYYEERYRERVLRQLSQRASKLGMQLVAVPQTA